MDERRPRTKTTKERLDRLLVSRGMVASREEAQALILAGEVTVDGRLADKAGSLTPVTAAIAIAAPLPYVSRGGQKLRAALDRFAITVTGRVALDVGASTGGFTDCLLQQGAARVYAVDVGYGQLHWRLRSDPRVIVMERTNARYLSNLPEAVSLVTLDVSFISLTLVLPAILPLTTPDVDLIPLIKPQFEAGKGQVGKGGVIRDPALHRAILERLAGWFTANGLALWGLIASPLRGPAGNVEFLAHVRRQPTEQTPAQLIEAALNETGEVSADVLRLPGTLRRRQLLRRLEQ